MPAPKKTVQATAATHNVTPAKEAAYKVTQAKEATSKVTQVPETIRKSSRLEDRHNSKPVSPEPVGLNLNLSSQPCHGKPEIWVSPLPKAEQMAVHAQLPSSGHLVKYQTVRGSWIPNSKSTRPEVFATTALPVNTQPIKSKARKKPANRKSAAGPPPETAKKARQSSEETIAGHSSDATISATSSPRSPRTPSASPDAAASKKASLEIVMLQHAEARRMSVAQLHTAFVQRRQEGLKHLGTELGHWMPVRTSEIDTYGKRHFERDLWNTESAVRGSVQAEAQYRKGEEREEKRRKTMGAMLKSFEG